MVDKLELPNANITRLVKDGASDVTESVLLTKDTKQAF